MVAVGSSKVVHPYYNLAFDYLHLFVSFHCICLFNYPHCSLTRVAGQRARRLRERIHARASCKRAAAQHDTAHVCCQCARDFVAVLHRCNASYHDN